MILLGMGILLLALALCSRTSFSMSPDTSTYDLRRPLPVLLPDFNDSRFAGVMYYGEAHHGNQDIVLNNGSLSSQNFSVGAFSLLFPLAFHSRVVVAPLLQWSTNNLFNFVVGAQASFTAIRAGSHTVRFDILYDGVFLAIAPSGGLQAAYELDLIENEIVSWRLVVGGTGAINEHYYNRFRTDVVPNASERYIGYLLSGGPFVGMTLLASHFFVSARAGYLFRRAYPDPDGTSFSAGNGVFASLSVGASLGPLSGKRGTLFGIENR